MRHCHGPWSCSSWTCVFNGSEDLGTAWTLPGVPTVRLARLAPSTVWYDGTPQGAQEVFEFSLQNITQSNAGVYFCAYFNGSQWSRNSNKLELVMTGIYNSKPFLTVDSGPQGISERNVTLLCHTHHSFDIFISAEVEMTPFPRACSHQDHSASPSPL
ncbi:leukocyte immunoglobulin-like receptor subfamily A member 5 isoform X2 [Arvicola amphibius]|uniref:leukocyte immunoglobulin-like receptor subfamily A member 5 isoform X2 n=1 Tax=Arvicola amphibius TaxID=1047088 RepID=UPI0018E3DF08|nr:leukocyte immunoglobulin-like receptor subfamily A member 5 isoform X2 [Arvicola amphibius]